MSRTSALDTIGAAWPGTPPAWVTALAEAVDRLGSQAAAGKAIGKSSATVNLVLSNKYGANPARIEDAVRAAFMAEEVACPVLGEIQLSRCLEEQKREFSASSAARVRLWKACRECSNRRQ